MDFQKFSKFSKLFFPRVFLVYIRIPNIQLCQFNKKKFQHRKNPYNLIFLTLIEKFDLPANFQTAISKELIEQMTSNFQRFSFSLI